MCVVCVYCMYVFVHARLSAHECGCVCRSVLSRVLQVGCIVISNLLHKLVGLLLR